MLQVYDLSDFKDFEQHKALLDKISSSPQNTVNELLESGKLTTEYIELSKYFVYPSTFLKQMQCDGVPWSLYEYQEDLIDNVFKFGNDLIIGKQRQQGSTTLLEGYCIWRVFFRPLGRKENIFIISKDGDTAEDFIRNCREKYKSLPEWIKMQRPLEPSYKDSNKKLPFADGSLIRSRAPTKNPVSGQPITLVVLDEHAKIEYAADAYSDIVSANAKTRGQVIIQSTGKGLNEHWVKWNLAVEGELALKPIFIPREWNGKPTVPERDAKFYEEERLKFSTEDEFLENHPRTPEEMFMKTGSMAFNQDAIMVWFRNKRNPRLKGLLRQYGNGKYYVDTENPEQELLVWDVPEKDHYYAIGIDVAGGMGEENDASVITVKDIYSYETVAVYYTKTIAPYDIGEVAYHLARYYNDAFIVGESNNQGRDALRFIVRTMGYTRRTYKQYREDRNFDVLDERGYGFWADVASKRESVGLYQDAIAAQKVSTPFEKSIKEHMQYILDKGSYRHPKGAHDDCVDSEKYAYIGCLEFRKKLAKSKRRRTGTYA